MKLDDLAARARREIEGSLEGDPLPPAPTHSRGGAGLALVGVAVLALVGAVVAFGSDNEPRTQTLAVGEARPLPTKPTTTLPVCGSPQEDIGTARQGCAVAPTGGDPEAIEAHAEQKRKLRSGELDRGDLYGFWGTYFTESVTLGSPPVLEQSVVGDSVYVLSRNEQDRVAEVEGVATVVRQDGSTVTVELRSMVPNIRPGEPVPLRGRLAADGGSVRSVSLDYGKVADEPLDQTRNWNVVPQFHGERLAAGQLAGAIFNETRTDAEPVVVVALRDGETGPLRIWTAELVADEYRRDNIVVVPVGKAIGYQIQLNDEDAAAIAESDLETSLVVWAGSK